MAIHETYSKRQKRLRGEFIDVYQYDDIPQKLKFQVVRLYEAIFIAYEKAMDSLYGSVKYIIENEYGSLLAHNSDQIRPYGKKSNDTQILLSFVEDYSDTESFLDVLELVIEQLDQYCQRRQIKIDLLELIEEINSRFKENAVGYQLDSDSLKIIRVDSQFVHSEVVKPTLTLLHADPTYAGALDEFILAHEHYRHGKYHDAIVNCGKSFESLLKAIHEKRGWNFGKGKNASQLILSCVEQGLFPSFQQEQLIQLNNILKSGVPTIRNNSGGHGDGVEVIEVPEHLVSYMIHLTASNLLFLAKADENLP